MAKKRIDALLVDRGLAGNTEQARLMVLEGTVVADNRTITKPNTLVGNDAAISIAGKPRYASRGGLKLEYALEQFRIDVTGQVAADIGASTGGFTDCLLQHGATRVYAVDVGYGQLDYRLRRDPRVVVMDRVNARHPFTLPEPVDLAAIDASFISVTSIIPVVAKLLKPDGLLVVLIKPQFEARREEVPKGGVIRDPMVHALVLGRFIRWAVEHDFRFRNLAASPILGASGNREFLALIGKP